LSALQYRPATLRCDDAALRVRQKTLHCALGAGFPRSALDGVPDHDRLVRCLGRAVCPSPSV